MKPLFALIVTAASIVVCTAVLGWSFFTEAQQPSSEVPPINSPKQAAVKASEKALAKFSEVVNNAVQKGEWTDNDGKALRAEYEKLSRSDKAKANDLLAASTARLRFPEDQNKAVVLPFDYF